MSSKPITAKKARKAPDRMPLSSPGEAGSDRGCVGKAGCSQPRVPTASKVPVSSNVISATTAADSRMPQAATAPSAARVTRMPVEAGKPVRSMRKPPVATVRLAAEIRPTRATVSPTRVVRSWRRKAAST